MNYKLYSLDQTYTCMKLISAFKKSNTSTLATLGPNNALLLHPYGLRHALANMLPAIVHVLKHSETGSQIIWSMWVFKITMFYACVKRERFLLESSNTTLSHCWGKQVERSFLMQQNLAKWTEAIPDDVVLPTFKDAIEVTRSLGIQYMWIDSLCIIQDSRADWLHESSHMSKIYMYSYCSIAATAAEDDAAGCFRDRDPLLDLPVQIDFSGIAADLPEQVPIGEVAEDEKRDAIEGTYHMHWERTWFFEIDFSPLIDRAWVVQEVYCTKLLVLPVLKFCVAASSATSPALCKHSVVLGM